MNTSFQLLRQASRHVLSSLSNSHTVAAVGTSCNNNTYRNLITMSTDSSDQNPAPGPQHQEGFSSAVASTTKSDSPPRVVHDVGRSTNIRWQEGAVHTDVKEGLLKQRGCVLWFTGLSGSGKSTVACTLEHSLAAVGKVTALLDGDNIRHGLNR